MPAMQATTASSTATDIEAAAKEGYFTMLTFDADLHSLSVTSVSPIKNDWIYNEEKFDLECYNVLGVY